jgi:hypothetical protein
MSRRGIPRYSIKAKLEAWQRAEKAADSVEATTLGKREADAPGGAARQERLLLDRLRNESHAEAVGEVWLRIERHFKKGDEGQHVVRRLLNVFTLAKNSPLVPLDYRRSLERLSQLKDFADQLYVYFTDEIRRDPLWAIIAGSHLSNERDFKDMVTSLRHIRLFLAGREEEFSHLFGQVGLSREIKAAGAQRVVFSAALSKAMHDIFGTWLDDVVRILTNVALDTETTLDQVKHARGIPRAVGGALKPEKTNPVRLRALGARWDNTRSDRTAFRSNQERLTWTALPIPFLRPRVSLVSVAREFSRQYASRN